jgi:CDP-diacylglycerol--glycerol-3-phosphate 3-phosphatidyltransferase
MNLANKITILRIIMVPVFMTFLLVKVIPYGEFLAAAIFILAAVTDSLDGYIARKQESITRLGKLMDPLADKLLISAALISLVGLGTLSPWVAFIIISREFAVTGLRLIAAGEGIIIMANKWGKIKTLSQIVMVVTLIIEMALKTNFNSPLEWFKVLVNIYPASLIAYLALLVAVAITIYSGLYYFYQNKNLINISK